MSEFTGERVIPGQVDQDLFNEHAARYHFAREAVALLPPFPAVLDAGCGTGYGAAGFEGAIVTAMDVSGEALRYAREHFARPWIQHVQARCETLPFAEGSFDMICAFEVIEHLERWRDFLLEARRVLKPEGILVVSTPNKAYYEEARGKAGPNPFHAHEFEYGEFRDALCDVFPKVNLWSQNHAAAIVFAPLHPVRASLSASGDLNPEQAHFFLAACGAGEIELRNLYAWIPSSANLLRERELHIAKLEGELMEKNLWLERRAREHSALHEANRQTIADLEESNQWAMHLRGEVRDAETRIAELQDEVEERLAWVNRLDARIDSAGEEILRLNLHREQLERELAKRAAWGFALDTEVKALTDSVAALNSSRDELTNRIAALSEERRLIAASKWMRFGRRLNLGPRVE